jgi:hypothetical protein
MAKPNMMDLFSVSDDSIDCGKNVGICTGASCPKFSEELVCCHNCKKNTTCAIVCKLVKRDMDAHEKNHKAIPFYPKKCRIHDDCPPISHFEECDYDPISSKKLIGYSQTCCEFCSEKPKCDIVCPIIRAGITGKDDKFYNDLVQITKS